MRKLLLILILLLFSFNIAFAKNIEELTQKAEAGDTEAQYALGDIYRYGDGVAKDSDKAYKWFYQAFPAVLEAADSGDIEACYRVSNMYNYGLGVESDDSKALRYMRTAADGGMPQAQYELAYMLMLGKGSAKNYSEALKWFETAAANGHVDAMVQMADMYAGGVGATADKAKALAAYEQAAAKGSGRALYTLGVLNAQDNDDYTKTFEYWLKAAEAGYVPAFNRVGVLYFDGVGVAKDDARAFQWIEKGAARNDEKAAANLAYLYYNGFGTARDEVKAFKLYQLLQGKNMPHVQYRLGVMYAEGKGVAKDYVQAYNYLEQAGKDKYAPAQHYMGEMYYHGTGLPKPEPIRAYGWLKAAQLNARGMSGEPVTYPRALINGPDPMLPTYLEAKLMQEQGAKLSDAEMGTTARNLGLMFAKGIGLPQDDVAALCWMMIAQAYGDPKAPELMPIVGEKLSEEDLALAEKMAAGWLKANKS